MTITVESALKKHIKIYEHRDLRRKFTPLEEIAQDPAKFGFFHLEPLESKAQQRAFLDTKKKVAAIIAGNRSGKTEAGAVKFIKTCKRRKKNGRAWILTESYDAQKAGVQEKLEEYIKPEDIIDISYAKKNVWSQIILKGANGAKVTIEFKTYEQGRRKLQSAKLFLAWMDEEPPEDIYDEIYTRTVDEKGQIIVTFTPLMGFTWSYERIYQDSDTALFSWGMIDNIFIPRTEIDKLLRIWSPKKIKMRIYGLYQGSERQVYEEFIRTTHVRKDLLDRGEPVDVVVDWGIGVTSIGFYQDRKILINPGALIPRIKKEHYLVDAVELEGAGYPIVMNVIQRRGHFLRDYFCDPAARGRSQATKSGTSLLARIEREFGVKFKYMKNVGVEESIDIVNSYMMNGQGEARLFIQEGIKLNDKGDNPEMRIEGYVRDEDTKIPIKDGVNDHFCFVGDTKIATLYGDREIRHIGVGDYVLTRAGYKRVADTMLVGNKQTKTYTIKNKKVTCTPDHKYITKQGKMPIDKVRYYDILYHIGQYQRRYLWQRILYIMEGRGIIGTEDIINQQEQKRKDFTLLFGRNITAQYLRGITFIIKTGILEIIKSPTLLLFLLANILASTKKSFWKILNAGSFLLNFLIKTEVRLTSGIEARLVKNGIDLKLKNTTSEKISLPKKYANIAELFICQKFITRNFVLLPARVRFAEKAKLIISSALVRFARKSIKQINTAKQRPVVESVEANSLPVYNITIEQKHEFFANDYLASNCDQLRYYIVNRTKKIKSWRQG